MILTSLGRLIHSIAPRVSYNELAKTTLLASTLTALGLIIALAALLPPSAPAEAQTSPSDATATPTATADPNATATPTTTPTGTATPTATADPNATATPTPTPTPTATPTVPPVNADYDVDNDGLIEIRTIAQLNAVRHDLNGNGKQDSVSAADWTTYTTAFLNAASDMGCRLADHDSNAATPQQATCEGYELMMDLNFDTDGDGEVNLSDTYSNWTPIGTAANPFTATFKSNSNGATKKIAKIYNLTITSISGSASADAGLFGATSSTARIEGIALVDANVSIDTSSHSHLNPKIGALVGYNSGDIIACYSTGAIEVTAGAGSYAGGLVGYNTGTIAAAFSRATVDIKMAAGVTGGNLNIYAGGLAGHNEGTLTATYAAGAVKGKGGGGYVGGLVGFNTPPDGAPSGTKTIIASYSIAPVTSVAYATTDNAPKPEIGGLTGCCPPDSTTANTITASYWDFMSSGIDDDSDAVMPEGKSTRDLTSPTSATGIYVGWKNLTIDNAVAPAPWDFSLHASQHPLLTYGGHTTEISGNQLFASSGIDSRYGGNTIHPGEGMTLYSAMGPFGGQRVLRTSHSHAWRWQSSTDGITWTTLAPIDGIRRFPTLGVPSTYRFVPRPEDEGKYIRAKVGLRTGGYTYTRAIGKIKLASTTNSIAMSFASGHTPPRIGTEITVSPRQSGAVGAWYRCDTDGSSPSGCERVGTLASYIPGAADLNHHLRAYIYYKKDGVWTRTTTGFTPQVKDRIWQWRLR